MVGIGSICLRIGTGGGLLWTRWWTSGFHKMLGGSRAAAQLAAPQEGLSSMSEWVSGILKIVRDYLNMKAEPRMRIIMATSRIIAVTKPAYIHPEGYTTVRDCIKQLCHWWYLIILLLLCLLIRILFVVFSLSSFFTFLSFYFSHSMNIFFFSSSFVFVFTYSSSFFVRYFYCFIIFFLSSFNYKKTQKFTSRN
jgi:hypothetical protein